MKHSRLWLRLLLSLVAALLADGQALHAQPPVVFALNLNAASSPQPKISLSIALSSNATTRLILSGAKGQTYRFAATKDFLSWTNWPTRRTDSNGLAEFAVSPSAESLFFRALSAPSLAPEVALGKRLFLETRFAQFFFAHSGTDVNTSLSNGDPVLDKTATLTVSVPGPFAGQSMNCRVCHLVDEQIGRGLGNRAYSDFAIRSPIPDRADGRKATVRNSPALANASIPGSGSLFLHLDGEFVDGISLVKGTFTGRNFGWLPAEHGLAVTHIARVIREDTGDSFHSPDFAGAYRAVLLGETPSIPDNFTLPREFRVDAMKASDEEILEAIARLVDAYLKSLTFAVNSLGEYVGSPYDRFLQKNALPRRPEAGEDDKSYGRRLRSLLSNLTAPVFVTPADGSFTTQTQSFSFGPKELEGLKSFLAEPGNNASLAQGKIGNCIVCHAPPHFTDFEFHNTGGTQWEYDSVHGEGAFARLPIPSLQQRVAAPNDFLPPTPSHPTATGQFIAVPAIDAPGYVDTGLWNIYANPDFPAPQPGLQRMLSARFGVDSADAILPRTIALFKTPGLRGLGQSAPYLHTGQSSTIESVIFFYRFTSDLAREHTVRNGDPEIGKIFLTRDDAPALAAFLRSLNEDLESE